MTPSGAYCIHVRIFCQVSTLKICPKTGRAIKAGIARSLSRFHCARSEPNSHGLWPMRLPGTPDRLRWKRREWYGPMTLQMNRARDDVMGRSYHLHQFLFLRFYQTLHISLKIFKRSISMVEYFSRVLRKYGSTLMRESRALSRCSISPWKSEVASPLISRRRLFSRRIKFPADELFAGVEIWRRKVNEPQREL